MTERSIKIIPPEVHEDGKNRSAEAREQIRKYEHLLQDLAKEMRFLEGLNRWEAVD